MIIELKKRPENEQEERPVNDGPARGVRIHISHKLLVIFLAQSKATFVKNRVHFFMGLRISVLF